MDSQFGGFAEQSDEPIQLDFILVPEKHVGQLYSCLSFAIKWERLGL